MKYLESYQLFERKGNYQLFHKTGSLITLRSIIESGYIICGGGDDDEFNFWNFTIRKNIFPNWKKGDTKFKTISATRNLNYLDFPALELDVEKISDKYKIIPFSENPDYYLDSFGDKSSFLGKSSANLTPAPKNKNLDYHQRQLRSTSAKAGYQYWRVKTDKGVMDYGISEEVILTDRLDVGKYVKRIMLSKEGANKEIIKLIKEKYPHIEVLELGRSDGYGWRSSRKEFGYADIKKALKQKEKIKEPVLESATEKINVGDYIVFFQNYEDIRENVPYQIIELSDNRAYFIDDSNKRERNFLLDRTKYKKVTEEEAILLRSTKKYNI